MTEHIFEPTVEANVCQLHTKGMDWLSTGFDGGVQRAEAAYNITVPEGWTETDLRGYTNRRLTEAGVENAVTAVLAAYRGFDTLGEAVVVYAAGVGLLLVLDREVFG